MSMPETTVTHAGGRLARERLEAYQRYSDLMAEQEAALERGDLEVFERLSQAALEVQAGLGMASAVRDLSDDPEAGSADFLEQTMNILRTTMRRSERIQRRLHALRVSADDEGTEGRGGRSRIGQYLDDGRESEPHFDLKF